MYLYFKIYYFIFLRYKNNCFKFQSYELWRVFTSSIILGWGELVSIHLIHVIIIL